MIARGIQLTRLDVDGAPVGETTWLPLAIVSIETPFEIEPDNRIQIAERYRGLFAETDGVIVDGPGASSPDTSQPYPLDALIERIDELIT